MNRRLLIYLLGSKVQDFVASLFSFGFLIIFYQVTHSLVYSSVLTAVTIIISRLISVYVVPSLKGFAPIRISALMNLLMSITAIIAIFCYPLMKGNIAYYFVLKITIGIFEELDNSHQYSIIPKIVDESYLFKANSLSAIITNINMLVSPLGSYLFYEYSDLRYILAIFAIVSVIGSYILIMLSRELIEKTEKPVEKKSVASRWIETLKVVNGSPDIMFCILIGVSINFIFAGLSTTVLLKMGEILQNNVLGQTIIKICMSAGSIIGVTCVYKFKVKENYHKYLKISIIGLILSLIYLSFSTQQYFIYLGFVLLTIFIMFIMNSTGTYLQMSSPKEELPSIYTFRSSLYAIVVPTSHIVSAIILKYFDRQGYFIFSSVIIILIVTLKASVSSIGKEKSATS